MTASAANTSSGSGVCAALNASIHCRTGAIMASSGAMGAAASEGAAGSIMVNARAMVPRTYERTNISSRNSKNDLAGDAAALERAVRFGNALERVLRTDDDAELSVVDKGGDARKNLGLPDARVVHCKDLRRGHPGPRHAKVALHCGRCVDARPAALDARIERAGADGIENDIGTAASRPCVDRFFHALRPVIDRFGGAERTGQLRFLGAAHRRCNVCTRQGRKLDGNVADASGSGVNEDVLARTKPGAIVERLPSRNRDQRHRSGGG